LVNLPFFFSSKTDNDHTKKTTRATNPQLALSVAHWNSTILEENVEHALVTLTKTCSMRDEEHQ
jgi:6,7-dimethyl-8-ribityllumazine synthase